MNWRAAYAFAFFLLVLPKLACAWWNDDWTLRKSVTVDTSASGAALTEPVGRFPVLVRLHDGVFPFGQAMDNGNDIRFVGEDDQTPLAFHLEGYDPLLGLGFAWVDIPDLKPGSKAQIWLYYGNPKAADVADAAATYDADTVLTYHFAEHNAPALDSTAFGNTALTAGKSIDNALIGGGLRLNGTTPITLPGSPSLTVAPGAPMTLTLWLKMDAPQPNAILFSRRDGPNALTLGLDQGVPFVQVSDASGNHRSTGGTPMDAGAWHHLAMVANGGEIRLLVDGALSTSLAAALPGLTTAATLGAEAPPDTASTEPAAPAPAREHAAGKAAPAPMLLAPANFVGDVDELHIAKVARSDTYLKALVTSEGAGTDARLVSVGADEESSSWLTGYFAILINAVTLDGWIVIGILAVMSVVSWIVMISKASSVNRQAKANQRFYKLYNHVATQLDSLHGEDAVAFLAHGSSLSKGERRVLRGSPLFRIFATGAAELHQRFGQPEGASTNATLPVLGSHALATLRSRLDAHVVREGQALNRAMVLLTIAISGGPFLGLLGTVIGVMITFAAIAAAGDVNVNAIAPGIAAALVATVAGLAVAIPALFGYNYLLTRIKDISADMRVFADEYATRLAESYRSERLHSEPRLAAE